VAAKASGYTLTEDDVAIVLGMIDRNDRSHDIAAWFGVNQGRIKEAKDGKFGLPAVAIKLPPKGAPGIKGRRLYASVDVAIKVLGAKGEKGLREVISLLEEAKRQYDSNEK
jgi:hypothetical protein